MSPAATELAARIRGNEEVSDEAFDQLLPQHVRAHSRQYWTPISVARRVAEWLTEERCCRMLDIGSGPGKLCSIVALCSPLEVLGIEHRGDLMACSRSLAEAFGLGARAQFIHAALGEVALPAVDAYFLYNPFGENLLGNEGQIDQAVKFSEVRFRQDVRLVQGLLRAASNGTCLITYNGFGGVIPPGYVDKRVERHGLNDLVLWRRE